MKLKLSIVTLFALSILSCSTNKNNLANLSKNNKSQKATLGKSYQLNNLVFDIENDNIREAISNDKSISLLKYHSKLDNNLFAKERERLTNIGTKIDPEFDAQNIKFIVDTAQGNDMYKLTINISQKHSN